MTRERHSLPRTLAAGAMRITPLGGLGEIGRNMTVFEYGGKLLIVDCGVLFPEEHHPGVDVILPDFSAIRDRLDDIVGLVITHGHEDHIGGIPYLLRERSDIPLISAKLSLAFVKTKLQEHRITPKTVQVKEGEKKKVGPFDLEFLAVNHSIPDGLAVAITTPAGKILHTGDFKMDQFPLDRRITDLAGFARLGEAGALSVLAIVDPKTGSREETPEFFPVGFKFSNQELGKATAVVQKAFSGLRGPKTGPEAERAVGEALTRWSDRAMRRKPVITVITVDAV